jgi:hypothetical protein
MTFRRPFKIGAVAVIAAILSAALLSNPLVTRRDVAAAYLVCSAAIPGKPFSQLRREFSSIGVLFAARPGGSLVGHERSFGTHWLCAVATDSRGHISGAVRL